MTRFARKFSKSCHRKPSPRACAISIPTMPFSYSKTCLRPNRPRFLDSFRSRSAMRSPASWNILRIRPAASCSRKSSPSNRICRPDSFWELYVVDEDSRLVGAVALDRLLRSKHAIAISDLFEDDLRSVRATDDQEAVARLFERYDLVAAPVVDDEDRLVGVITFDDIVDVIEEEAEEDIKALGGVSGGEELSDSVLTIARSRFPWLAANLLTALLSSWVISNFQSTLEKMVALAVLMPIVASMGGNAGTQTMTVAVRALATRELSSANAWRIIRRE